VKVKCRLEHMRIGGSRSTGAHRRLLHYYEEQRLITPSPTLNGYVRADVPSAAFEVPPLQLAQGVEAEHAGADRVDPTEVVLDFHDLVPPIFRYRVVCDCKNYSDFT
jgi:hypothetical protein